MASDRQFLVQPLALRTPIGRRHARPLASHSKHFGEGARSGKAPTVVTLQLASSHAGGASGLAFRHLQHALFRRARARSCHAQ